MNEEGCEVMITGEIGSFVASEGEECGGVGVGSNALGVENKNGFER